MLKNKYLYTKLAAFASKDKARPIFNYLNFTGEEVVETNTHWLAVAKGYKAEPHMESTDGSKVECPGKFPEWRGLLPSGKQLQYSHIFEENPKDKYSKMRRVKQVIQNVDKAVKMPRDQFTVACLVKEGEKVYYLVCDRDYFFKVQIFDGIKDLPDFRFYCAPTYLEMAFDLLDAAEPDKVMFGISESRNIMFIETDGVLILGAGVRVAEDLDHRTIKNFVNDEFPPKTKPTDDDDLDFLD